LLDGTGYGEDAKKEYRTGDLNSTVSLATAAATLDA
jgi:hypothetical protein